MFFRERLKAFVLDDLPEVTVRVLPNKSANSDKAVIRRLLTICQAEIIIKTLSR